MEKFEIGDIVQAVHIEPLNGNDVAPPLEKDKEYPVKNIIVDSQGNQHLDVGLGSLYNFIRSYETKEELPNGHMVHWCHPSRFKKIKRATTP